MRPGDRAQSVILGFEAELTANALLPDPRKPQRAVRAPRSVHGMREPAVIPPVPPLPKAPAVEPVRSALFVPASPLPVLPWRGDLGDLIGLIADAEAARGSWSIPATPENLAGIGAVISMLAELLLADEEHLGAAA